MSIFNSSNEFDSLEKITRHLEKIEELFPKDVYNY